MRKDMTTLNSELIEEKLKSERVLFPRLYHGTFYGAELGHEKEDLRPKSTFYLKKAIYHGGHRGNFR
jgi:hypothetical protein